MNNAEHNKLFGWKPGVKFREPLDIQNEIDDTNALLEKLDMELREAEAWHSQRCVFDAIANHIAGKPLTDDQACELHYGWVEESK